jgi:deoxyribonuclease-4
MPFMSIKKHVGAHVSSAGGVFNAPLNAARIGANAFALFTKNQRQWQAKAYAQEDIEQFRKNCHDLGFAPTDILAHDSYLINIGSPETDMRIKSVNALLDEAQRCEQLGIALLNIHPGSHLGKISEEQCLDFIAQGINTVLAQTATVTIVVENTAGQGSNMGYRFEHLAHILAKVEDKKRVGVCIDTCHASAAGYRFDSAEGYASIMSELDALVGLEFVRGFHLNDSKFEIGSHKDRHASLGQGTLGLEGFKALMHDERFNDIPLILETPDEQQWAQEIVLLHSL